MKLSQIKSLILLCESHPSNLIISSADFISPVHINIQNAFIVQKI